LLLAAITAVVAVAVVGASAAASSPPKPVEHSVFLCYSTYQVDPGVWMLSQAETLFKAGYWQPYAVAGNVVGGTNVGTYHLVCNLATGQSVPAVHGYVGGGGTVVGPDMHTTLETNLAFYPIAG
jgi:hypothetical protein